MKKKYFCPYLNANYKKTCPVTKCIAHIDTHKSGCIHNAAKGDLTLSQISYFIEKPVEKVEKSFQKGLDSIKGVFELKAYLDSLSHDSACTGCGNTNLPCIPYLCLRRAKIIKKIKSRYPFTLTELNVPAAAIFILLTNKKHGLTYKHHRIKKSIIKKFRNISQSED